MTDQSVLDKTAFEDLVNLTWEQLVQLYENDLNNIRTNRFDDSKIPEHILKRQALRKDRIQNTWEDDRRNNIAIANAVRENSGEFTDEELTTIWNKADSRFTYEPNFPSFSEKIDNFIGRQFYLGGDYYVENVFLPGKIVIKNFIKRFGDVKDMKNNLDIYRRLEKIRWPIVDITVRNVKVGLKGEHINLYETRFVNRDFSNKKSMKYLIVPIVDHSDDNRTTTYTHMGTNVLDSIKEQTAEDAFKTVKEGLIANLEFAWQATENKDVFKRELDDAIIHGQRYIFSRQPKLKRELSDLLKKIAPGIEEKEKKKITRSFYTGHEKNYVVPLDPRTSNTITEHGEFKLCDIDGLTFGSIHHILHGYLEKIGKVQPRETEFIEIAYEFLCDKQGKNPDLVEMENFKARYLLQKPVENLKRVAIIQRKLDRDAFQDEENQSKLKEMANLYFNRALRDLEKMEMFSASSEIARNVNVKHLSKLDELRYFDLEKRLAIDEHDYKSMLISNIDARLRRFHYQPEHVPFSRKVLRGALVTSAISLGGAVFIFALAGLSTIMPKDDGLIKTDHSVSYIAAQMINKQSQNPEIEYGYLWGDFDNSSETEIKEKVKTVLAQYMKNRHPGKDNKPFETMSLDSSEYDQLFGYDFEVARTPIINGYYVDNLTDRWSMTWGLDPEFVRAASHASVTDLVLNAKARREGYVGEYILMPLESVRETVRNRSYQSEKQMTAEYWQDPSNKFELASIACQFMASHKGNVSTTYARLFTGSSAVNDAIKKANSDDFEEYRQFLPPMARELTERALAFHIPMMLPPIPAEPDRFFIRERNYSYEPIFKVFENQNFDLVRTIEIINSQHSE